MNRDFRNRVLFPLLLPLGVLVGFLLYAVSLSRVFLAIPELAATTIALLVAGYILFVAGLISVRRHITSNALAAGLVVGMVAVLAAGALSAQAGMRELHPEEEENGAADGEEGEPDGEDGEPDGEDGEEIPADAAAFVAVDINFAEAPETIPAGEQTLAIDNEGAIFHDLTIDELDFQIGAEGGEAASATTELEPGEYVYYCSVPGHREAGMEGTFVVE